MKQDPDEELHPMLLIVLTTALLVLAGCTNDPQCFTDEIVITRGDRPYCPNTVEYPGFYRTDVFIVPVR